MPQSRRRRKAVGCGGPALSCGRAERDSPGAHERSRVAASACRVRSDGTRPSAAFSRNRSKASPSRVPIVISFGTRSSLGKGAQQGAQEAEAVRAAHLEVERRPPLGRAVERVVVEDQLLDLAGGRRDPGQGEVVHGRGVDGAFGGGDQEVGAPEIGAVLPREPVQDREAEAGEPGGEAVGPERRRGGPRDAPSRARGCWGRRGSRGLPRPRTGSARASRRVRAWAGTSLGDTAAVYQSKPRASRPGEGRPAHPIETAALPGESGDRTHWRKTANVV